MTYKVLSFRLEDRGTLYMVSQVDCIEVDKRRFDKEAVVDTYIFADTFDTQAEAWQYIGRLMSDRRAVYAFIPNTKEHEGKEWEMSTTAD